MLVKSKVLENRILTSLFFIVCLFIFSERLPTIYSQLPQSSLRADEIKLWLTRANFKKRTPIAHKNNISTNLLKKVSYCTFQKHANSEVQKAAFTFSFFAAVNHNTITSNEPCNTETHKTYRNPSVITEVTNHDLLNLLM